MVCHSFHGLSISSELYWKTFATNFYHYFVLHCNSQVATIFTLISDFSVKILPLNCLPSNATRRLRVKIVEPKLRSLIFRVTGRGVRKEDFIALNVQTIQNPPKADLKYHIAKKLPIVQAKITKKCKLCFEEFSGFYGLQKQRSSQHETAIKTSSLDMETLLEVIDDKELKTDLNSCNHFLVDSKLEKSRNSVFNFAMS